MRPALDPAVAGLVRAVRAHVGGMVVIVAADSVAWSVNTFTGARHCLTLRLDTAARADAMARALPDHEFRIAGHLVADVAEIVVEGGLLRFAVLTVEEA
jgi:hypothetical protein